MKNTIKSVVIQFSMSLIGVILVAFGLAATVRASIGLDPWGVLFNSCLLTYKHFTPENLQLKFITYGNMITIISALFVVIASLLRKERLKVLSIISGIFLGTFVNLWIEILGKITFPTLFIGPFNIVAILIVLFGIIVLSFGSSISLQFPILMTPVDYLVLAIKDRFPNQPYGIVRTCIDTSAVILGSIITYLVLFNITLIPLGLGTILNFFLIGYVINFISPRISPILTKIKSVK